MARGDPVDGIRIVRYLDAVSGQLVPKSYRPRAGDRRSFVQLGDPLRQLLRPVDARLPEPGAVGGVERGEDLAPPAVEDGKGSPVPFRLYSPGRNGRTIGLLDASRQRVERADAAQRQAEADAEPAGGRDPDPQAGKGAGAEPDGDQVDLLPAPRRGGGALDLLQ